MNASNQLKNKFNQGILHISNESMKIVYNPARFIQMFYAKNKDGVLLTIESLKNRWLDLRCYGVKED